MQYFTTPSIMAKYSKTSGLIAKKNYNGFLAETTAPHHGTMEREDKNVVTMEKITARLQL